MEEAFDAIGGINGFPGTPIKQIEALTNPILEVEYSAYFLLIHQALTSEDAPAEVKSLIAQFSMEAFIGQLLPVFKAGQEAEDVAPGDLLELISSYLSVLSGLMILHLQGVEGYRILGPDILIRLVTSKC